MRISAKDIDQNLELVRRQSPLVHNITNYVVMNLTANALLAVGASPVMAHAREEVEDMVNIASALVINIGTLSAPWIASMKKAARKAQKKGIPIIYDPVGAGATPFRTRTIRTLIQTVPPAIVRGNASEIIAIADDACKTKGVDSAAAAENALDSARWLSEKYGCVVCVSGATDYIIDKNGMVMIKNGHALMPKVTGLGCTATALCGAFAAVNPNYFATTTAAMAVMGIAGEIAAEKAKGPASMQVEFLDALFNMKGEEIKKRLKIS
ncbi:MAG: hydroxyethylthiazole kinase [Acidobacteria bacterium]|nr:hydroxyethylthiazole kinase [Acidobacteriota bacterium]MBU4307805.1 hydroxyethylthiazole kinase [Acidobacteriota bacterium]MCG2810942.1 hydroxyethylthiazole kinase [Candidatus Aminicenantes bacterium]